MTAPHDLLQSHVDAQALPGAVALLTHGDDVEVAVVGSHDLEGTAPMARDSIFRIASITRPITAATVMMLVEDGRLGLDAPIDPWLPELASPMVVRTPQSPVDDVVPAARAITARRVLALQHVVRPPGRPDLAGDRAPPPRGLRRAVLRAARHGRHGVCRAGGRSRAPVELLPRDRRWSRAGRRTGRTVGSDARVPLWRRGLASTVDDYLAFTRMLVGRGEVDGVRLLSPDAVRLMTTNHLNPAQRAASRLSLDGQGWGYGACVDVDPVDPGSSRVATAGSAPPTARSPRA